MRTRTKGTWAMETCAMRIRSIAGGALFAVIFVGCVTPAVAIACAELPAAHSLESDRYRLSYRTVPENIVIGQHFTVEFVVCPREGQPAPEGVRIDATMPEHRHGMNYKPSIKSGEGGRYVAEGMLFHMAGRWQLLFEVRAGGKVERLTRDHMM